MADNLCTRALDLICPICYSNYDKDKYVPVWIKNTACGHSICSNCLEMMPTSECPICRHRFPTSGLEFVVNGVLSDFIDIVRSTECLRKSELDSYKNNCETLDSTLNKLGSKLGNTSKYKMTETRFFKVKESEDEVYEQFRSIEIPQGFPNWQAKRASDDIEQTWSEIREIRKIAGPLKLGLRLLLEDVSVVYELYKLEADDVLNSRKPKEGWQNRVGKVNTCLNKNAIIAHMLLIFRLFETRDDESKISGTLRFSKTGRNPRRLILSHPQTYKDPHSQKIHQFWNRISTDITNSMSSDSLKEFLKSKPESFFDV